MASKVVEFQSKLLRTCGSAPEPEDVLIRCPRRKHRSSEDRGLPPDSELEKLAGHYLDLQRKLWPDLVAAGLLPKASKKVSGEMVETFKERHRSGRVHVPALAAYHRYVKNFGGSYKRFSCDNSDPKSILDQLFKILHKAREQQCFVPWEYVFCDYSVTGMDASRRGYTLCKTILGNPNHVLNVLYIDDFTRASRETLEWWRLAYLCQNLKKGMFGASDGFTLSDGEWDMKITIYGLISRLFIKQLRQKVRRGMAGTARNLGTLGVPPLGFTRKVVRNNDGEVVRDVEGIPKTTFTPDPGTLAIVYLIYHLYVNEGWTPYRIINEFNTHRVNNWDGWTEGGVRKILRNPAYIGVFIWNRTRREYDMDLERFVVKLNPRTDWTIVYEPKLAVMDINLWKAARRKIGPQPYPLAERGAGVGRPPTAAKRTASWLFSDTMFCKYCGKAIRLYRSTEKYSDLYCVNGPYHKHGCQLATSKATRVVEGGILNFLRDALLTEDRLADLVRKANTYLKEEVSRPKTDLTATKVEVARLEKAIGRLVSMIERSGDDAACEAYHARLQDLQPQLDKARKTLREGRAKNEKPPAPLKLDRVKSYVSDLRSVLTLNTPKSAELLRKLTGRILVRQEDIPGRRNGAKWIAEFSPDLLSFLADFGREQHYPDSIPLEFLNARNWIKAETVEVTLEHMPKYEILASDAQFLELARKKLDARKIHFQTGWAHALVLHALRFWKDGTRPPFVPQAPKRPRSRRDMIPHYVRHALEVGRLKDIEKRSVNEIAKRLSISPNTVADAYAEYSRNNKAV